MDIKMDSLSRRYVSATARKLSKLENDAKTSDVIARPIASSDLLRLHVQSHMEHIGLQLDDDLPADSVYGYVRSVVDLALRKILRDSQQDKPGKFSAKLLAWAYRRRFPLESLHARFNPERIREKRRRAPSTPPTEMSSSTTEIEFSKSEDSNMDPVRQCLDDILGQLECMLAKEESCFKQSPGVPTLFHHEFQKEEILLHSLQMIIKKSVKLMKENKILENMQFLEKVVECASDLYQLKNPIPLENEYENDEIQLPAIQNLQTFFQELDSYIQTADLSVKS